MNVIPRRVGPWKAFPAKGLAKHHHVSRSSTTTTVSVTPAATLVVSRRGHSSLLPPPTVLFSNNHLLVINKPPGWCAAPNADASIALLDDDDDDDGASRMGTPPTAKCLLSHLQRLTLGGGSQGTYLVPVHRLDQPCSGVQLYAKTSRAASRIQRQWRDLAKKSYVAVLDSPQALQGLVRQASLPSHRDNEARSNNVDGVVDQIDEARWYELRGYLERRRTSTHRSKENHSTSSLDSARGWSVTMIPAPSSQMNDLDLHNYSDDRRYRLCSIRFQVLCMDRGLIRIATRDGARHVIRALLSSFGAPLAGDLRYGGGAGGSRSKAYSARPLPDRSVALHGERLEIIVPPSDARAKASFLDDLRGPYVAPIPPLWDEWFGIR
jgi:23S rRNA-/tRNA-specific pseudouridylate synthase